jgi:acetyl-CoA C-acetyltransferase
LNLWIARALLQPAEPGSASTHPGRPNNAIMKPIWIASGKRTPHGRFLGALARQSAIDLGIAAARAVLCGIDPALVDSVIIGNVLGAGLGMNVARQIGIRTGLPVSTPAYTVNMMCASGMQAVILAIQAIQNGLARMVLCGGVESMSNAPYLLDRARAGYKLGDGVLIDSVLRDGITDAFNGEHMGLSAERLAGLYGISREAQDRFAATSQDRYAAAYGAGHFCDEIVAVEKLEQDEPPRLGTTFDSLGKLKPAFDENGTITAGNASGISDGAAMLVICDDQRLRECGLNPLMSITATATVGCEPSLMGLGPVHATRRISPDPNEFDMIELNEAFAAQALACIRELKLDEAKVNTDGGAIALGHPIGASGARLLVHLAHRKPRRGLATLCVGGGMGCAVVLERGSTAS